MKNKKASERPAMMRPAQKVHLQVMTEMKPEMTGAIIGPQVVA